MAKYHKYFVSWVVPNNNGALFGNHTFSADSQGTQLVEDALCAVRTTQPNAILLSISKLD